jgi:hypothetical protein
MKHLQPPLSFFVSGTLSLSFLYPAVHLDLLSSSRLSLSPLSRISVQRQRSPPENLSLLCPLLGFGPSVKALTQLNNSPLPPSHQRVGARCGWVERPALLTHVLDPAPSCEFSNEGGRGGAREQGAGLSW